MGELDGKVAIITGAGRRRSIGRGAALALARLGCNIVVTGTGRNPSTFPTDEKNVGWKDINSVVEEVQAIGPEALALVVDVSDRAQVQAMVDRTLERFGRVDILVNNASTPRGADRVPVVDLPEDALKRVFEVKVFGSFYCAQAVARVLIKRKQGGKIINMSSAAGKRGTEVMAAYASANAAVHGFTMSLARELGPYNINVNAICPGLADTARNDVMRAGDAWEQAVKRVPLGRACSGDDVGEFIAFLCTRAGSYIHGQCINFCGGLVMEH
jgi:NAD(P)-dependent dehydrogenase (short-subunit alcohol dehydrogenase family)